MVSVAEGDDVKDEPIADIVSFDRQSARIRAAVNDFYQSSNTARKLMAPAP
jgi:hypothetical protein